MVFLETVGRGPAGAPSRRAAHRQRPGAAGQRRRRASPAPCSGRCPRPAGSRRPRSTSGPGPAPRLSELVTVAPGRRLRPVPRRGPRATCPRRRSGPWSWSPCSGLIKPSELRRFWRAQPDRVLGRRRHGRRRPGLRPARRRARGRAAHAAAGARRARPARRHRAAADDRRRRPRRRRAGRPSPVPGLLVLRFDGPLYTANVRSVNRKVARRGRRARRRRGAGPRRHGGRPDLAVTVMDELACSSTSTSRSVASRCGSRRCRPDALETATVRQLGRGGRRGPAAPHRPRRRPGVPRRGAIELIRRRMQLVAGVAELEAEGDVVVPRNMAMKATQSRIRAARAG